MGVRWSGMEAAWTTTAVCLPGEEIGEDVVEDGQLGLVLGADDCHVVTGTKDQLVDLLATALKQVEAARFEPEVSTGISEIDGVPIVQIDTKDLGRIRVFVNEGAVYDCDPEIDGPHELVADWRRKAEDRPDNNVSYEVRDVYEQCASLLNQMIGGEA